MKKSADPITDYFKAWLDEESSMPENGLDGSENDIIRFSEAFAIDPPQHLKNTILQRIKSLHAAESTPQALDINDLPMLTSNANWLDWQTCVQHISPPDDYEHVFLHTLDASPRRDLFVVWVKGLVEEEVHHDLVESFIVLEGSCECTIKKADGTTQAIRLSAGDYLEIPVSEPHNVIITSLEPVKAILQWLKKTG